MKKETPTEYRIVQYPDKDSPSGKVYFVDKKVVTKIFWFFKKITWQVVKWSDGKSLFWFDFNDCTRDVEKLKNGHKLYS